MHPRFEEDGNLMQFDIAIANIPWNQDGYGEDTLKKAEFNERFSLGHPPGNMADWAWIQHILASIRYNGRAGIVVDNGCLFRSGREEAIRREIVKKDWVDCVILTPEKLFYNTGVPGTVIIFNKNKSMKRENKILFINASEKYEDHPEVRKLNILSEGNIGEITQAYKKFQDQEGFSRVVLLDEIEENDYNLNVILYVFPEIEIEDIDVGKEWRELHNIKKEIVKAEEKIEGYIKELE